MRPVDQTRFGINDGNCFSACVASILEIPLGDVPLFVGPDGMQRFATWLAARDLDVSFAWGAGKRLPPGWSIAGGPSKRFAGRLHACVARDGIVVHDPHPSRDGLVEGIVGYVVIHGARGEPRWFNELG